MSERSARRQSLGIERRDREVRRGLSVREAAALAGTSASAGLSAGGATPAGAAIGIGIFTIGVVSSFLRHKEASPALVGRPDVRASSWEANPPAQHVFGKNVDVGGKILFALHKKGDETKEGSKRLDLVIGCPKGPFRSRPMSCLSR